MAIKFTFNVKKKITVNGREFEDLKGVPEEIRKAIKKDVNSPEISKTKITFNGQEYKSLNDMPDDVRRMYEMAVSAVCAEEAGNKTAGDISLFRRMFPRTILKWREPEAFRDARKEAEKSSFKRLSVIITVSSIIFIFFINLIFPEITYRLFAVLALLELFIFFVASVYRVSPYYVWITDTAIVHDINIEDPSYINFKDIRHCEIATVVIEEVAFQSLIVEAKKGERELIGIAASININELKTLLEKKGLMVMEVARFLTPEGAVR